MARTRKRNKATSLAKLQTELEVLNRDLEQDLRLPSLTQKPPRLQGYSFKFSILLPVLSATGEEVFTNEHLAELFVLLNQRFGGFSGLSGTSHPPIYGFYQPVTTNQPEKDFHTQIVVYAAPLDAANQFFARLKDILRTAPLQPQEEILIERLDAMLI